MSDEPDTSGKDQYYTNGSPQEKFEGSTEFSISYHQAQQLGSEDVSNGITHVTHLHAVPGFSYMVNSPSQQREDKATDDGSFDMDFSDEMMKAKPLKKTMSHPPNGSAGGRAFENDSRPRKGDGIDGLSHGSTFVGISEISLRTQPSDVPPPSRPPPAAEGKKGDSGKLVPKHNALAFGGISGDCSPPFFDEEVDASSSAAVSAAAMKEAMEKAQAKLKSAKELMEKKKEGLQSSYKLGSKKYTKEKAGETVKIIDGSDRLKDERVNSTFAREDGGMNVFAREEKKKASKTALEGRKLLDGEELFSPFENNTKAKPEKESWSSGGSYKIDEASEWKEATEFFELVTTDEPKKDFELASSKKIFLQSNQIHEHDQRANEAMKSFEKKSGISGKENAATEDYKLGESEKKKKEEELCGLRGNNSKSKEEKKASELKDCERQLKMTCEVWESEENKKSTSMVKELTEANKNLAEAVKSVKVKESKSKSKKATKQKDNEEKVMGTDKVDEIEKHLKLFYENVDQEDRERRAFDPDRSHYRYEEVFEQAGKETKVKKGLEQEENETWLKEILEKVKSDRRPKEVATQQENKMSLNRPLEQRKSKKKEKKKEKEKEAFDLEDAKRHNMAHEIEEIEEKLESVSGDREIRKKALEQEDSKGRSKLCTVREGTEVEQLDTLNTSKEFLETKETKQVLAVDSDLRKRLNMAHDRIENNRISTVLEVDEGTYVQDEGEDLLQSEKAHKLDCGMKTQPTQLACDIDESCGDAETTQDTLSHEVMKDAKAATISNEMQAVIFERESEYVDINLEASSISEKFHLQMEDAKEAIRMDIGVKNSSEDIEIKPEVCEKESAVFEMEYVLVDEKQKAFGKSLETLDDQVKKTGETGSVIGEPYAEKVKSCSPVGSDSEKQKRESAHEWEEKEEERLQAQASLNREEKKESTMPTQSVKESIADRRKEEASQLPRAEEKQRNQKSVQQVNASQATDRKEKISDEVEDERMKRAREMEKESFRKVEEERERDEKQKYQKLAQQVNMNQTTERKEKKSGVVEAEWSKKEREMENERARKIEEEKQKNQKASQQVNASQTMERREKTFGEVEMERMRIEREVENEELRKIEEEKQKNQKASQQVNASQTTERREKTFGEVEMERMRRERDVENEKLRKIEEEKQKNQKSAHQINANQTMERRDKTFGEVEMERMRREREVENEKLRKFEEEKQKSQKSAQQINASQTVERREKTYGEVETERMRREREMENERLRKIEEEEREREREKDRMAVDLATLEARERVFGESRERAERTAVERATAEARQRAMAEARERLEKACAEAREKSLAGKTAMEARIRTERAAVERATAEARERAAVERATAEARERAERAMAERAAFEARERVQRSVSDKFSASSRSSGLRHSSSSSDLQDPQFQGVSRFQYSSVYSERNEGVEGESAQRCKARLERHRRTAERAAKALAEKNMRDLLAQREQAERSRLAETLDADVRRWCSGKEGNLRALLSTLQYILGSDSGWQPVPLTEVITSAAVKKAYRKATLCVHPDKLQQRGASIQQKYICEKVFDLLKEAWNKFNSEER